jgi:probable F420-dependent oxidoreductase
MKGPHMHVDAMSRISASPIEAEAAALAAERAGYDGIGLPETKHDVFTTLTLAARATTTINLQSAIAVAFARNPMTVAYCANDVQLISGGRLQLGLGSQVQPHVERRFAMPWSAPAARMEDFIAAVRAIWTAWSSGNRLMYKGRFYSHTLMTEFFNPGPNEFGNPPIWLAAVGAKMSAVAGRVADGLICHSFTTEAYLREVTLPAVAEARGSLDDFSVALAAFVVLGDDEASRAKAAEAIRGQIAFYGSTPSYLPVLELHGWGELHTKLNALARQQAWTEMGGLITDDVLDAFAVSGSAAEVAARLTARFGDAVQRMSLYTPYPVEEAQLHAVAAALRA